MGEFLDQQDVMHRRRRRFRWRKGLLRVEQIARVVCVWLLLVGGLYGAGVVIFTHDVFPVRHVMIRGELATLDEATIRAQADIPLGTSLFRLSMAGIQERLRRHPWIREVAVRRKLPDTVWIYVSEREAVAILHVDRFYLVDRDGEIFKAAAPEEMADYPVISGVSQVAVDRDGVGHSPQLQALMAVYRRFEQHPLADQVGCSEILLDAYGYISLVMEHPAVRVRLGPVVTTDQFDRLQTVLSLAQTGEERVSSIDCFFERKIVVRYAS